MKKVTLVCAALGLTGTGGICALQPQTSTAYGVFKAKLKGTGPDCQVTQQGTSSIFKSTCGTDTELKAAKSFRSQKAATAYCEKHTHCVATVATKQSTQGDAIEVRALCNNDDCG